MVKQETTSNRDRVFFHALLKLEQYIEENIRGEGFLPSEAKMCELFGVSRITCRAVLAAFRQNGFIVSYPKKGHYVLPREYRVKKVGLVIGSGKESPFIASGKIVSSFIDHMEDRFINCQIIQSSVGENLKWRALAHGVRGLVWVLPDDGIISLIQSDNEEIPFPQVVVSWNRYDSVSESKCEVPIFSPDRADAAVCKAEFFLQRGHRKILFIDGYASDEKILRQVFRQAGVPWDRKLFIDNDIDWEENLRSLVANQAFTAAIIGGGPQKREAILRVLDSYSGVSMPEVLIPSNYMLAYFRDKYPNVHFVASTEMDWDQLGRAAAQALAGNILDGQAMQSQQVKMQRIDTFR